jgi:hypothetical protein
LGPCNTCTTSIFSEQGGSPQQTESEQRKRRQGRWVNREALKYDVSLAPVQHSHVSASLGFVSPTSPKSENEARLKGECMLRYSPMAAPALYDLGHHTLATDIRCQYWLAIHKQAGGFTFIGVCGHIYGICPMARGRYAACEHTYIAVCGDKRITSKTQKR